MQRIKNQINSSIARAHSAAVRGDLSREEGQGTVEYVLVAGLVVVMIVGAATALMTGFIGAIVADVQAAITGAV